MPAEAGKPKQTPTQNENQNPKQPPPIIQIMPIMV